MSISGGNSSIPLIPLPWRGWVTCWGSDICSRWCQTFEVPRGTDCCSSEPQRGFSAVYTLKGSQVPQGRLRREYPSLFCSSAEPSRAAWFLETRIPAPPSISNYPFWGRRGESHLLFELPKNTIFLNIYSGSFPPAAFDPAPAGSARGMSGAV